MKPVPTPDLFAPGAQIPIETVVVTAAMMASTALLRANLDVPTSTAMDIENPLYPWEPNTPAPAIIMEPGRTPQEKAA